MGSLTDCSLSLQYNADIAGQGVRISFYIQNFVLVIMVWQDPENALWTLVATSFGLTVAALVQLGQGQLTLLQGILVSQLAWFSIFGTYLSLASYSRSKGRDSTVKVVAVIQSYFSMILTICMWGLAHRLPLAHCPDQPKYVVLFGLPLNAFGGGRIFALVVSILTLILFTVLNVVEFWQWSVKRQNGKAHSKKPGHKHKSSKSHSKRHNPSIRHRWIRRDIGSLLFGIIILQIVNLLYFMTTTELTLVRSHATLADSNTWGFGQVLAMTVVIPSIISLGRGIFEKFVGGETVDAESGEVPMRTTNGHSRGSQTAVTMHGLAPPPTAVHPRRSTLHSRNGSASSHSSLPISPSS